jgi:hypothetical protein
MFVCAVLSLGGCPILQIPEPDYTEPIITLNGSKLITLECGEEGFVDPGVTAWDDRDGVLGVSVTYPGGEPDGFGIFSIIYQATDAAGNTAYATRSILIDDTLPPTMSSIPDFVRLECGSRFQPTVADAHDLCDGEVQVQVFSTTPEHPGVGQYSVEYFADDSEWNHTSLVQDVLVTDTIPPRLQLEGAEDITWYRGVPYSDPGYSAVDLCDESVPVSVTGRVDTAYLGTFLLTYEAIDGSANTSRNTRTVTTIQPCASEGIWSDSFVANDLKFNRRTDFAVASTDCGYAVLSYHIQSRRSRLRSWGVQGTRRFQNDSLNVFSMDHLLALRNGDLLASYPDGSGRIAADGTYLERIFFPAVSRTYVTGTLSELPNGSLLFVWNETIDDVETMLVASRSPEGHTERFAALTDFIAAKHTPLRNGSILIVGSSDKVTDGPAELLCLDAKGGELFRRAYPSTDAVAFDSVFPTATGAMVSGRSPATGALFAASIDFGGAVRWSYRSPEEEYEDVLAAVSLEDDVFLAGNLKENGNAAVLKLDSTGDRLWTRTLLEEARIQDLVASTDGGVAVVARSPANVDVGNYGVLLRIDSEGRMPDWPPYPDSDGWMCRYNLPSVTTCSDVRRRDQGYTFLAHGGYDDSSYLVDINTNGELFRSVMVGRVGDIALALHEDGENGFYIGGTRLVHGGERGYLTRVRQASIERWEIEFPANTVSSIHEIVMPPEGNSVVIAGWFANGLYVASLDPSGTVQWQRNLAIGTDTTNLGVSLVTFNGEVIVGGGSVVAKFSSNGQLLWQVLLNHTVRAMAVDDEGSLLCAGDGVLLSIDEGGNATEEFQSSALHEPGAILYVGNQEFLIVGDIFRMPDRHMLMTYNTVTNWISDIVLDRGGFSRESRIIEASDGGYILCGGDDGPLLVKLTPDLETDLVYQEFPQAPNIR